MAPEPVRTCVGCRARAPKSELLRMARAPDGGVMPDPAATAPGRGAYVHRDPRCVRIATRNDAVGRTLRVRLDREELVRLMGRIEEVVRQG